MRDLFSTGNRAIVPPRNLPKLGAALDSFCHLRNFGQSASFAVARPLTIVSTGDRNPILQARRHENRALSTIIGEEGIDIITQLSTENQNWRTRLAAKAMAVLLS